MKTTPKSLRLQIGLFGRTNVGKSSFLNVVAGQDVAITSSVAGTTTDVVEKTMELLPIGPVVFLDTAGLNDSSDLSESRIKKTKRIFDRADVVILIVEPNQWTEFEDYVYDQAQNQKMPLIIVVNKIDIKYPDDDFISHLKKKTEKIVFCSSITLEKRDDYVNALKENLIECCPEDFIKPPSLIGDLMPKGGLSILIIPIDLEAPKGRIILPQVQTIRDALDHDSSALIVKEDQYLDVLEKLKAPPDIVVCDSQVVDRMVLETPSNIKCTTFSIIFARLKCELSQMVEGAIAINSLQDGDKILIAEACSHHAVEDDIGRIKIPRWIKEYTKADLKVDVCAGRDYPEDLSEYKLVILCGSCMITRKETLRRMYHAKRIGVPVTNYGVCISFLKGVLGRVLEPFPDCLKIYQQELDPCKEKVS
ncbi:MAG: [FeFe] hydrogenase H-cluster maturation GTPase HydF [Candidatus Omnitrophica bacterium]|nr:[FeFe] hydrogenase H-cluster maturation GTPase HydF [Candidatus Omnitrophota bacterium]